ncbi:MAG TPA: NUDIX hydrolase [Anaerovoracaceae bacterium]|nr:NUDIX hydrolase [Anaerovoracaceae bacterium]
MNFTILDRETTYKSRAFNIQKVRVQLPNDKIRNYDLVDHNDSVIIVPVDQDGDIWFVSQYRLGAESQLLELPAGVLDDGEDPIEGAARELREEIGMSASNLKLLGSFYLAAGYSNENMFAFLATGLQADALEPDADEFLEIKKIPISEVYRMAHSAEFNDSKTLAALLMTHPFLPSE